MTQATGVLAVPPPIVCAGDPYALGRAQGEALASGVRACHAALRELEAFQLQRPWMLPHGLFVRLAERRAAGVFRREVARAAPETLARAHGIADGAGMRRSSLHLLNVLEPLLSDLSALTVVPPLGGCSALAVGADRAAAGEPVIARNFDYLRLIQPFYTLRETRPAAGLRSLDFTCAPLCGAVDGVNEAGLAITCNYAYAADEAVPAGTATMAVAAALAQCRDTAEAAAFLTARARWGGGLLMLADAHSDIASLELSNGRAALRRPGEGDGGALFHTNRFQTAAMRAVELPRAARYTTRAPGPLRGVVVHDSAAARDARFQQLLASGETIGPEQLRAILGDHGDAGRPSSETICMHGDYWSTTATLQLYPRSRRVRVAFDAACRADFADHSLGDAGSRPGAVASAR